MNRVISREEIKNEYYREILDIETHHNHEIIGNGVDFRWKENPDVRALLNKISLNYLIPLLEHMGFDKNTEVYRKLYRDMGYSLCGYWEVFYWEVNNPDSSKYIPNTHYKALSNEYNKK